MPNKPQSQASTLAQLRALVQLANQNGLYDAANAVLTLCNSIDPSMVPGYWIQKCKVCAKSRFDWRHKEDCDNTCKFIPDLDFGHHTFE